MKTQASKKIAEAVSNGKAKAIILPDDFKSIVNPGRQLWP
jgi:hypothetical protein